MTSDVLSWSPISGGSDPLDDLSSHQLDLLRYIFDRDILAISAQWSGAHKIRMRVRLVGGVIAQCTAAHGDLSQESITLQCGSALYQMRLGSERVQPMGNALRYMLDLSDALKRRIGRQQSSLRRSYERQLFTFLHYVRTGECPKPGIGDGIACLRAVEAARKSGSGDGQEVVI